MPYHLRETPQPKCKCGKPATVELFNDKNAPCGHFCKPCGARALREALQCVKRLLRGNPW